MLRKIILGMMLLVVMMAFVGQPLTADANQCTVESGQLFIDSGQYKKAIQEFSCVIDSQPAEVEGYRGRIEAKLMLGRYSDAVLDYTDVMRFVLPVHPDAEAVIYDGYNARLDVDPDNVVALTGKSFAQWWFFHYPQALQTLNQLVALQPDNVYGVLFSGSSRVLGSIAGNKGVADLDQAIALAPQSPDVRYIVSDAYTYGISDPQRALAEASFALAGGLSTPRVHAILGAAYNALGDTLTAAAHIQSHFDLVTTELVAASPIAPDTTYKLDLVAGRAYEIPVVVTAGEAISIATSSKDYWDTILVLIGPDGSPVIGSDDTNGYFAAIDWTAEVTGTYKLKVTFFESASFGELVVARD